ncbi:hypothetical protein [Gordonia hongkongensis]|nr:hypothetical protein [Gordonia hongkongensis]UPG68947.1 hypothetical protein MVF96_03580 [Gordonia hongkongensis]
MTRETAYRAAHHGYISVRRPSMRNGGPRRVDCPKVTDEALFDAEAPP